MAAPMNPRVGGARPSAEPTGPVDGSRRYWAPCLAVALVAMSLFYVNLKELVQESAARASAAQAAAAMPAYVEPRKPAGELAAHAMQEAQPAPMPSYAPATNVRFDASPAAGAPGGTATKPAPAVVEVHKCVMPEGDAAYSDGPCPEGAQATTLRLPRDVHAAASL